MLCFSYLGQGVSSRWTDAAVMQRALPWLRTLPGGCWWLTWKVRLTTFEQMHVSSSGNQISCIIYSGWINILHFVKKIIYCLRQSRLILNLRSGMASVFFFFWLKPIIWNWNCSVSDIDGLVTGWKGLGGKFWKLSVTVRYDRQEIQGRGAGSWHSFDTQWDFALPLVLVLTSDPGDVRSFMWENVWLINACVCVWVCVFVHMCDSSHCMSETVSHLLYLVLHCWI